MFRVSSLALLALPLTWAACEAGNDKSSSSGSSNSTDNGSGGAGSAQGGGPAAGPSTGGSSSSINPMTVGNGGSGGMGDCVDTGDDVDDDGDGWTNAEGDCNDCDPNINPNAVEVPTPMDGDPFDEDCDNEIDEPIETCDDGLALASPDAMDGARAIELCKVSTDTNDWGVISAAYVRADGTAAAAGLNTGISNQFGANIVPQEGSSMVVLSSGNARDNTDDGNPCGSDSCSVTGAGTPPTGFPQVVPGCPDATAINDDIALEVQVRAPSNATGYSFDFSFMSYEFPEWVCTQFNDQFVAIVDPAPMGAINGNISFDSQSNPVSVNIALFDHCDPAQSAFFAENSPTPPAPPNPYCPLGHDFMTGTGFDTWGYGQVFGDYGSGSTGWLVTTAPVEANEIFTIRFAIWDAGDTLLDATATVDNFRWTAEPGTSVGTEPIPDPD